MDPLTHTMTGAALGRAGLRRTTPLATATLVLAANAPDVDVFAYAAGNFTARAFRRGITHGLPAMALLPFLVAGAVLAWDRWMRRRRDPGAEAVDRRAIVALAALGVWTHPVLDWMNTYGLRWLMPFRGDWTYGDALFIVDPWLWLLLGGALLSGRNARMARRILVAAGVYVLTMVSADLVASREVAREAERLGIQEVREVMVAPRPANPFSGEVVVDVGDGYVLGSHRWLAERAVTLLPDAPLARVSVTGRPGSPPMPEAGVRRILAAASERPEVRQFLVWARFPFWRIEPRGEEGSAWAVRTGDARYPDGGRLGGPTVVVEVSAMPDVPAPDSSAPGSSAPSPEDPR